MFTNCKLGGSQGRADISERPGRGSANPATWWEGRRLLGSCHLDPHCPPSPALRFFMGILIPEFLCPLTCAACEFAQSQLSAMFWAPLLGLPASPKTLGILGVGRGYSRTSKTTFNVTAHKDVSASGLVPKVWSPD